MKADCHEGEGGPDNAAKAEHRSGLQRDPTYSPKDCNHGNICDG